ncbi:MAG: hypothetical protein P0Y59_16220 [Candidatus Sphingomonas phytovorans]|nr:hypothetical protein [Sphingomonas sp.]WEJ98483.1 MAG: hypothetical protein P0Y59_16220 [Sphingomonas sp.]
MAWKNTAEDEATYFALGRAIALVVVPGMILVFGLIYLVSPRRPPPSLSWPNGTYLNPCCAPLTLKDGTISTGLDTARYTVAEGKSGYYIDIDRGIGVNQGAVTFGGAFENVFFNRDSEAVPALGEAYALHLNGVNDSKGYIFTRRTAAARHP